MNIVLVGFYYPMAILRYFENALKRRKDINLLTSGIYTGTWIPWKGGIELPHKYAIQPDIPFTESQHFKRINGTPIIDIRMIEVALNYRNFNPDLWIIVDAGCNIDKRPRNGIVATIATDPHVLNYDHARSVSDYLFNMQEYFMKPGDILLPYAYDPGVHYPLEVNKLYDGVLMGLMYPNRIELATKLINKGYNIKIDTGLAFDEYREFCNRGLIGLNWSSREDIIARVYEYMAMRVPMITNRIPLIEKIVPDTVRGLLFDDVSSAVSQFERLYKDDDLREGIITRAYKWVTEGGNTYDDRIEKVLEVVNGNRSN